MALRSTSVVQCVSDPTNTQNVIVADYANVDVNDILKSTLPYTMVMAFFTLTSIREAMNCSEKSAIKYLSELEEFGLIERIKQGLGKPALIYVKNFLDQQNLQVKACKDYRSGTVKIWKSTPAPTKPAS